MKKLRADGTPGITVMIQSRVFYFPVCCPEIQTLKSTEL
jgi:hypothetical protein